MSEQDPVLRLSMDNGTKHELTPSNAVLYTFLGKTTIGDIEIDNTLLNHAFYRTSQNEQGQAVGMYFFRHHPAYKDIAAHMSENRFPMVLNQREVPACDLNAYFTEVDRMTELFAGSIPDSPPEE